MSQSFFISHQFFSWLAQSFYVWKLVPLATLQTDVIPRGCFLQINAAEKSKNVVQLIKRGFDFSLYLMLFRNELWCIVFAKTRSHAIFGLGSWFSIVSNRNGYHLFHTFYFADVLKRGHIWDWCLCTGAIAPQISAGDEAEAHHFLTPGPFWPTNCIYKMSITWEEKRLQIGGRK